MEKYEDKNVTCVERGCGKEFTITAGEQRFFVDKGFYLPRRCQECRDKRRAEKEERMGN